PPVDVAVRTLPLHGALPITHGEDITRLPAHARVRRGLVRTFQINQLFADMSPLETLTLVITQRDGAGAHPWRALGRHKPEVDEADRKSTRLNSSPRADLVCR